VKDLTTAESLEAAGFPAPAGKQERFVQDVVTRRQSRMELPTRRWLVGVAGAILSGGFAAMSASRGDLGGALACATAAATHLAMAGISFSSLRARAKREDTTGDGCWRDDGGVLRLSLEEGERVLKEADADGAPRPLPRKVGGMFTMMWGVLLGGLPLALLGGQPLEGLGLAAAAVGTFFGTYVFGRGVMSMLGAGEVERLVLTDRRIALLAAPGVTVSLPLTTLEHRPVVVGREAGRATLALAERKLPATAPLPLRGLVGLFDLDDEEARGWAGATMDARRARKDQLK
jgi:hypothetical protein